MPKTKIILITLTILVAITLASLGYYISQQNQVQDEDLNVFRDEVGNSVENFSVEFPNFNNVDGESDQQDFVDRQVTNGSQEPTIDNPNQPQLQNEENQLGIRDNNKIEENYSIEIESGRISQDDEKYNAFADSRGLGILGQNGLANSDKKLFLKNNNKYLFVGYDVEFINFFEYQDEGYWFILTINQIGKIDLFFFDEGFTSYVKIDDYFDKQGQRVQKQEDEKIIEVILFEGNARGSSVETTQKINIEELFIEKAKDSF